MIKSALFVELALIADHFLWFIGCGKIETYRFNILYWVNNFWTLNQIKHEFFEKVILKNNFWFLVHTEPLKFLKCRWFLSFSFSLSYEVLYSFLIIPFNFYIIRKKSSKCFGKVFYIKFGILIFIIWHCSL